MQLNRDLNIKANFNRMKSLSLKTRLILTPRHSQ